MDRGEVDFEDLEIYKLAREWRKKIYRLARKLPEKEKFLLKPQMFDAARSLTNNIAEGNGRYYYQAQIRFMRDSLGSLNEITSPLSPVPLLLGSIKQGMKQNYLLCYFL